ncbi:MAG: hypothetical protein ACUVRV_05680 [Cyanobacteriota bacterium]
MNRLNGDRYEKLPSQGWILLYEMEGITAESETALTWLRTGL